MEKEESYYSSGNLKSVVENDEKNLFFKRVIYYDSIKQIPIKKIFRNNDKHYDSIVYYYNNGEVYKTFTQSLRKKIFGCFFKFTREGFLSTKREYYIIDGRSVLNRKWYFNKDGDTLWYASNFNKYDQKEFRGDTAKFRNSYIVHFDFYSNDTITLAEPFAAAVRYGSPLAREHNSEIIFFLAKENKNYNEDFSNEKEVEVDTFYNLTRDQINRENFPGITPEQSRYVAVFGRWFKKPGEKILRGYMKEFYTKDSTPEDPSIGGERKVYFEKKIFVKDTVN